MTLSRRERVDFTLMTFITGSTALSYEPYGFILSRGDSKFRLVADRALAAVFRGAEIRRLYFDWFGHYGERMSPSTAAQYCVNFDHALRRSTGHNGREGATDKCAAGDNRTRCLFSQN
jgi:hypothetical protein